MHLPLSSLKQTLYEHQQKAESLCTGEEYVVMRYKLLELRRKFASYEEWELYQKASDLVLRADLDKHFIE
ncbi:hypothetical protein [Bacillus atrophaeus]|uniref:hypothetical protein n=1 Tax=Bacillus atrophaeus TaxID=1452 RepID=UPI0022817A31|nr:hypothetical protein [Bacillus atrophaeus]MCY8498538.1 hypothetical protein [Bacillus atrophaeus]MCY8811570.1 hypothetical protein [Bacillus atrophaeus]MCY8819346.1 hypothetical protein [Bacillus atrophaeus]MCY8830306.1 hypothetical protein [Bacillus atrophaeus]MCY8832346.1 hypothetical protein [Bacillus atrophaeus]